MSSAECRHPDRPRSSLEGVRDTRLLNRLWAALELLAERIREVESGAVWHHGSDGPVQVGRRGRTGHGGLEDKLPHGYLHEYGLRDLRKLEAQVLRDLSNCVRSLEAELNTSKKMSERELE